VVLSGRKWCRIHCFSPSCASAPPFALVFTPVPHCVVALSHNWKLFTFIRPERHMGQCSGRVELHQANILQRPTWKWSEPEPVNGNTTKEILSQTGRCISKICKHKQKLRYLIGQIAITWPLYTVSGNGETVNVIVVHVHITSMKNMLIFNLWKSGKQITLRYCWDNESSLY
jgi:hypothetical protein